MLSGPTPSGISVARALYVHSPFCVRRCPYCDFDIALFTDRLPPRRYLDALELEVDRLATPFAPRSVFVGGGTPTVLKPADLDRFFQILSQGIDLSRVVEFSIEANPENLRADRIELLASHRVTRASLGAQSFQQDVLDRLGRRHSPDQIHSAVRRLREAGIPHVNVDLIHGAPGQDLEALERDLDEVCSLDCDHVSAYSLTYEPGTEMTAARDRGALRMVEESVELEMLRIVRDRLEVGGFRPYEVSNYARAGGRCIHNLTYWRNHAYLGLGPGAVSYSKGIRRKNHPDLATWCAALEQGQDPIRDEERLNPDRSLLETLMLALRTPTGLRESTLRRRFGLSLAALDQDVLGRLEQAALIDRSALRIRPTRRGLELADGMAAEFF